MRNIQAKQGGESKSIQAVWRHKAWIWQNYLEKAGSLSGLDWLGSTFELGCCTLATESGIQYTVQYASGAASSGREESWLFDSSESQQTSNFRKVRRNSSLFPHQVTRSHVVKKKGIPSEHGRTHP